MVCCCQPWLLRCGAAGAACPGHCPAPQPGRGRGCTSSTTTHQPEVGARPGGVCYCLSLASAARSAAATRSALNAVHKLGRAVRFFGRLSGRWVLDALLVSLCVCLLLVLGVMLQRGTRPPSPPPPSSDTPDVPPPEAPPAPGPTFNPADLPDAAAEDEAPRARLMSLGFALLLVSLGVCLYTMYRLGFCCRRREYNRGRLRSGIPSVNSRLHLISATDLPPTYDAIMLSPRRPGPGDLDLQPPPYFTIITFQADKVPPPSYPAPSPRGMHGTSPGPATGAGAGAGRPQEAG